MTKQEVIRRMIALNNKDLLISDFTAHGNTVQDLSKDGFQEVAKLMGGFQTVSFERTESDEHYMATVLVVRNQKDLPTEGMLGAAQVEKMIEVEDYKTKEKRKQTAPEAHTMVMHIAQRNALSHLIQEEVKRPILDFYFRRTNPLAKKRNEVMSLVTNRKGMLTKHFGDMDKFWTEFQTRFEGATWVDLTTEQLDESINGLKNNKTMESLADWLRTPKEKGKNE